METIARPRPVRGRLAPTPSGRIHLGNARSFLLAWLWARSAAGRVVMRIEDVDRPRCRPELREAALDDLAWLGLDWDEGPRAGDPLGPYDQSTRFAAYREALERLVAAGRAYACVCSRRDVEEASRAPHGDEGPVYPGTCRGRFHDGVAARTASGREPTWRFRWDGPPIVFRDGVAGETSIDPAGLGDFVLWRRDELPSYQLAVVVDDAAQGVTQVLRGADLLSSTARQLSLYGALGLRAPEEWAHVPFLRDEAGGRMAKRDASLALGTLRSEGIDPRRLVGALARTAGLLERDQAVTPADLVDRFAIGRIAARDAVWTPSDHAALVSPSSPVIGAR